MTRALFVLVPLAYLNLIMVQPASSYDRTGPVGISVVGLILMVVVLWVCLLMWSRYKLLASMGLIACFLWVVGTLLPVI